MQNRCHNLVQMVNPRPSSSCRRKGTSFTVLVATQCPQKTLAAVLMQVRWDLTCSLCWMLTAPAAMLGRIRGTKKGLSRRRRPWASSMPASAMSSVQLMPAPTMTPVALRAAGSRVSQSASCRAQGRAWGWQEQGELEQPRCHVFDAR